MILYSDIIGGASIILCVIFLIILGIMLVYFFFYIKKLRAIIKRSTDEWDAALVRIDDIMKMKGKK